MAGVLEQVTQMKNQGLPDNQIVNQLRQQGVSPREINDALNQAQIKNAVSDIGGGVPGSGEGMQPSVMNPESSGMLQQSPAMIQPQDAYVPQPMDEYSSQEGYYPPQEQDDYYQEGGYDYGDYAPGASSADTMIEIAEQVFSEKIRKIQKQVEEMNEFKTIAETKLETTINRLKKIEATIDKLQSAVLDKVGSYGKNLDSIKKEMSMMQDSFGKVVKGLSEKTHSTGKKTSSRKK